MDNSVNKYDTNVFQVYSTEEVILFGFPMSPASCGPTVVNLMLPVRDGNQRRYHLETIPDSKAPGANMGPIWGRQDPGGPHVGPMNFAIWDSMSHNIYWLVMQITDSYRVI